MNKEQVQKHGDIIKWFCDNPNKGVWRKDTPTNDWYIDLEPSFYEDYIYVQNDEYAEYRKALAEGKSIQHMYNGKWCDCYGFTPQRDFENEKPKHYRIKPEELKFEEGDWVKYKISGSVMQAYEGMIYTNFELWKPKKGEWCVFWNDDINDYFIAKHGDYCSMIESVIYTEFEFEHIAPLEFIQTLKNK